MASEVQKSVGGTDGQARKPVPQYGEAGKPMPQTERLERLSYKWRVGKPVAQMDRLESPSHNVGRLESLSHKCAGEGWRLRCRSLSVAQMDRLESLSHNMERLERPGPQVDRLESLSHRWRGWKGCPTRDRRPDRCGP